MASSTAPVSEPGTIPSNQSSGRPRIRREPAMTSASFALPALARCDRPSTAPDSAAGVQPGRLAQGPEEKHGFAGRRSGGAGLVIGTLRGFSRVQGGRWRRV